METKDIFNLLHNAVEASHNGKKISQRQMAEQLGLSMRTYQDWRLGNTQPQSARAIFDMLSILDEDELLMVVKRIKKLK